MIASFASSFVLSILVQVLLLHCLNAFQVREWTASYQYPGFSTATISCDQRRRNRSFHHRHAPRTSCTTTALYCTSNLSITHSRTDTRTTNSTCSITLTVPSFYPANAQQEKEGALLSCYTYPSLLHNIHIQSILTDEEAAKCLQLAKAYAQATGCWEQPDQRRHASYATCDFAIEDCTPLSDYLLTDIDFNNRMWTLLSEKFGVKFEDMSYLDFFCVHYRANNNCSSSSSSDMAESGTTTTTSTTTQTMDRLQEHRDGSLLSFTVLLNPPDEFQGGGTFFEALKDYSPADYKDGNKYDSLLYPGGVVRLQRAGDACLHSGKLLHGADVVQSGERTVLVGFVDVGEWRLRPGALSTACREWGRMDSAQFRYKRLQEKIGGQNHGAKGWFPSHSKWLDRNNKSSHSRIQGFCPAFSSVERRADPKFQRKRRLEAEDILLQTILLPDDAESPRKEFFGGNITIMED